MLWLLRMSCGAVLGDVIDGQVYVVRDEDEDEDEIVVEGIYKN